MATPVIGVKGLGCNLESVMWTLKRSRNSHGFLILRGWGNPSPLSIRLFSLPYRGHTPRVYVCPGCEFAVAGGKNWCQDYAWLSLQLSQNGKALGLQLYELQAKLLVSPK